MSRLALCKDIFFKHISSGISNEDDTAKIRKVYLVNIFIFVAILFVFPLGINALFLSLYPLAFSLLAITLILIGNYIYLKVTHKENVAAYIISVIFFLLMTYLIYDGGILNTGPIWVFSLPIILMFLLGFMQGLLYITLFILINSFILFFPNESLIATSYDYDFKIRIILSLILVTFLTSASEYLHEKSFNDMIFLRDTLEMVSRKDPLTGLYNRRIYDEDIYGLNSKKGVILICDIDHFKNINDTYGHTVGDHVLVQVAECIRKNIRKDDLAIRWGGEEFFIFLSNTTIDNGYKISEKLRKSIENLAIQHSEDTWINVTISIGVSLMQEDVSLGQAITNADNAMYRAKDEGRNKSVIYRSQI